MIDTSTSTPPGPSIRSKAYFTNCTSSNGRVVSSLYTYIISSTNPTLLQSSPTDFYHFDFIFNTMYFFIFSICILYFIFQQGTSTMQHLYTYFDYSGFYFYCILFLFLYFNLILFHLFLFQGLRGSGAVLARTNRSMDMGNFNILVGPTKKPWEY